MVVIRFEQGNLLDYEIFCHQVNCQGKMGAGLAKQIRSRYPIVYSDYMWFYNNGYATLGRNIYSHPAKNKWCVSMFAQDKYGRDRRYTDYTAFKTCLKNLEDIIKRNKIEQDIAFPYGIGCGLAGGDWNIVLGMLKEFSEKIEQDVVIVSLK